MMISKNTKFSMVNGLGFMVNRSDKKISRFAFKMVLALAIVFLFVSSQLHAETYFVDPVNGSDTNAGSDSYPWKTISKALGAAVHGDTVVLKDGNYDYFYYGGETYSGDATQPLPADTQWLTIKAEHQHQAIVNYDPEKQANRCVDLGVGYAHNGDTRFIGLKFDGIAFNGKFYTNEVMGLRVINCLSYSEDEFLDMHNYETGFTIEGGDIVIENTEIRHHKKGITLNGDNIQILKCDIHDIGIHHMFISGNSNILIDGNKIRDHSKFSDDHGDAIIFYSTQPMSNITIRNNEIYNHINLGIYISYADTMQMNNFVLENNLMYNIEGYALTLQHIHGGKITHNTINGGVRFGSSGAIDLQDVEVFNNFFSKCYAYNYDESCFSYHGYNIYIRGAGGGGYTNLGFYEADSFEIPKDTPIENTGLFVDALGRDYSLVADGKAVNFGRTLNAPATDIVDYARDASPDAGCYEYAGDQEPVIELIIEDINSQTVLEGQNVNFDVVVNGAPIEDINCIIEVLPDGATFAGNHFDWTPAAGQSGLYFIKIIATCGEAEAIRYVIVTVEINAVLHGPVFGAFENTYVLEGEKLILEVRATDPDGDELTYSADNLPEGAIFYNNAMRWVPEYGQTGTYIVQFAVSDGVNETIANVQVDVQAVEEQSWTGRRLIYYWRSTLSLLGEI